MMLALVLALAPGVSAQQHHMLGAQGPTIALDRFAGFDTGAGPLSYAELPAAARTLDRKLSLGIVAGEHSKLDREFSKLDHKFAAQHGSRPLQIARPGAAAAAGPCARLPSSRGRVARTRTRAPRGPSRAASPHRSVML